MNDEKKKLAIVFWSAFYLPALQIFLLLLIGGVDKWTVGLSLLFFVMNYFVFKTFDRFRMLPMHSKFIAGIVFPVAILFALVAHHFVEIRFTPTFLLYAVLTLVAVYSSFDILKHARTNDDSG